MKVEIEPGSGFCFGVENAIRIAEEALRAGEKIFCLGEIVHNDIEVDRLKNLGLITISHDEFVKLRDSKVLIRAHGEPPSTYETARQNNITIIEATCPIVHSLQGKVKQVLAAAREKNGQDGQATLFDTKIRSRAIIPNMPISRIIICTLPLTQFWEFL